MSELFYTVTNEGSAMLFIITFLVGAFFVVLFIFFKKETFPYVSAVSIMSKSELAFFRVASKVIDGKYLLFTKVRMEDVVCTKKGLSNSERMKYRGKIKSRHIDFILCQHDGEILAGIELDDKSHNSKSAKEIDAFKDWAFKSTNLPLHRVKASNSTSAYIASMKEILRHLK